jgi:hypothetical protein
MRTYDAADVFALKSHTQAPTFDALIEIPKQRALEEAEDGEPEPEPEPAERTATGLKLTVGRGLTAARIKTFVDSDWNGQRAAAGGQRTVGVLACCEEILKDRKRAFLWPDFSACFLKVIFSTRVLPRAQLKIGVEDPGDRAAVQKEERTLEFGTGTSRNVGGGLPLDAA